MSRVEIKRYCSCGASAVVTSSTGHAEGAVAVFDAAHSGDGHRPVSAATCARARRRAEDAAYNAWCEVQPR